MSATSSPLPTVTRSATSRSPTSTSTSSGAGLATQTPGGDDDSLFPGFGDFLSGAGGGLPSGGSSNLPSTGAGLGSSNSTATKASVTVGIGIGVAIAAVAAAFGLYVMVKKLRAKPEEDSLEEAKSTRNSMLSTEPVIPSKEFTVLTADRPMSILPAPVALPSTPMPSDPIGTATVRNIYSPRDDDEVTVQIGDVIEIFRRYDDGWVYGRNTRTNQSGVLPEMIL
ncbi:hypothetical protein BKA69DRAFT_1101483 [Paraphysoderma sedebokerense]|nr:hypothetical protein BKA69DRAFT_1101483 [Paraphysoderma sedebokerense]